VVYNLTTIQQMVSHLQSADSFPNKSIVIESDILYHETIFHLCTNPIQYIEISFSLSIIGFNNTKSF
jgi:hypothetical protein